MNQKAETVEWIMYPIMNPSASPQEEKKKWTQNKSYKISQILHWHKHQIKLKGTEAVQNAKKALDPQILFIFFSCRKQAKKDILTAIMGHLLWQKDMLEHGTIDKSSWRTELSPNQENGKKNKKCAHENFTIATDRDCMCILPLTLSEQEFLLLSSYTYASTVCWMDEGQIILSI